MEEIINTLVNQLGFHPMTILQSIAKEKNNDREFAYMISRISVEQGWDYVFDSNTMTIYKKKPRGL